LEKETIKLNAIINEEPAVLVYFKNNQCAPCIALRPKVQELIKADFPKLRLEIVDSMENPELAGQFNVFANPTLIVFFAGKESIRKSKYVSISELTGEIERLYTLMFD